MLFLESTLLGDTSLRKYFRWSHESHSTLLLSWAGNKLAQNGVRHISVIASLASKPHRTTHHNADVATGHIILRGLLPGAEYLLTTQAIGEYRPIFAYTIRAKTWKTGKSDLLHAYSFPFHGSRAKSTA